MSEPTHLDIRHYPQEERKHIIDKWVNTHLKCKKDFAGHSFEQPRYDPAIKAWIWGPCLKCDEIRITQTTCNDIWIHPSRATYSALIVTDDFADPDKIVKHVLGRSFKPK